MELREQHLQLHGVADAVTVSVAAAVIFGASSAPATAVPYLFLFWLLMLPFSFEAVAACSLSNCTANSREPLKLNAASTRNRVVQTDKERATVQRQKELRSEDIKLTETPEG